MVFLSGYDLWFKDLYGHLRFSTMSIPDAVFVKLFQAWRQCNAPFGGIRGPLLSAAPTMNTKHGVPYHGKEGAMIKLEVPYITFVLITGSLRRGYLLLYGAFSSPGFHRTELQWLLHHTAVDRAEGGKEKVRHPFYHDLPRRPGKEKNFRRFALERKGRLKTTTRSRLQSNQSAQHKIKLSNNYRNHPIN